MGVEKVLEQNGLSVTSVCCRVFLFSAWLGGGWQNGCCGFAEEPHESFDVLGTAARKNCSRTNFILRSASDAVRSDSSVPRTKLLLSFCAVVRGRTRACWPTRGRVAGWVHPCGWQDSETLRWCIGLLRTGAATFAGSDIDIGAVPMLRPP